MQLKCANWFNFLLAISFMVKFILFFVQGYGCYAYTGSSSRNLQSAASIPFSISQAGISILEISPNIFQVYSVRNDN
jgi:hypothetical protein